MLDPYIQQYGQRLYGLCLTLCADRFDADDLYQTTWLKVMQAMDRYDPAQDFEPWLTKICVNTYRSSLRRLSRSPFFNAFRSAEEKADLMEATPAPERHDYSDLYTAIDRLPEKLRLTVILYYFQELDITSLAAILQIPPGTVKSRLHKARHQLKEVLQDETDL